jgi:heterodisulfide reductase subunit A-like polyferredoxin
VDSEGFKGNFSSTIQYPDGRREEIRHGAVILATGAQEYRGPEYGYGQHPRILTQQEFEARLSGKEDWDRAHSPPSSVVMIQCVGPAESYCSRICCTVALKNALALKEKDPETEVTILYRDIRTYGFKERLYTQAREAGVIFVRYDPDHKPEVSYEEVGSLERSKSPPGPALTIRAWEPYLKRELILQPDYLVLSMPVVPNPDVKDLVKKFKVSMDADGFFLEAHVKLRPVDFATDGVFMAGMAHYPKLLDETMIQAQAAAARAARVLSQETLAAGGRVAVVEPSKCTGCLTCVRVCPFQVPKIQANLTGVGDILGAAHIEAAICQGCGTCAAECPAQAIQLMHYTDAQMAAKVDALVEPELGFVPINEVKVH